MSDAYNILDAATVGDDFGCLIEGNAPDELTQLLGEQRQKLLQPDHRLLVSRTSGVDRTEDQLIVEHDVSHPTAQITEHGLAECRDTGERVDAVRRKRR